MKTVYYKHPNNCFYLSFIPKTKILITVNLYSFFTGIQIDERDEISGRLGDEMIKCTKLEFDKSFHLAIALISNKSVNVEPCTQTT